jgi:acetyltransferase-like isoleucine patch superfamily enzyme
MHSHMMSREIPKSELHLGEHAAHLTRIFSRPDLPPRVRAMRRLAYCELHYKTGVALYFEGHRARALVHLARATTLGPDVVARRRPIRALRRRSRGLPLDPGVFVHDTARCESSAVGAGTKVWAYAHVMDGARVGVECKIGDYVFIESGAVIGDRVTVKNGTLVWDHVVIDDDVFVGPGVVFTNDRVPRARNQKPADELAPTRVCEGASIGANSTIVCGTTIGRHAMVGAGSVVTRDVTAYALVMGNPAAQVGWVCECGERLGPELKCGCGRRYRALGVTLGEARSIEPDPD